jgi:hypothetical protein
MMDCAIIEAPRSRERDQGRQHNIVGPGEPSGHAERAEDERQSGRRAADGRNHAADEAGSQERSIIHAASV